MVLMVVGIIYLKWERTLPAKVILSRTTLPRATVSKVSLPDYGKDSGEWQAVGKPMELVYHAHDLQLLSSQGSLYLAFTQEIPNGLYPFDQRLTLLKWNGQTWMQIGEWNKLQSGSAICLAPWKEKLYAVIEHSLNGISYANHILESIQLEQWNGDKWSKIDGPFIIKKYGAFLSCFKVEHGIPYVGLLQQRTNAINVGIGDGFDGSLIKYMDHSWRYVGTPHYIKHVYSELDLAFIKGTPLLLCIKDAATEKSDILKFNGRTWKSHLIQRGYFDAFLHSQSQLYLFLKATFQWSNPDIYLLMKYEKGRWVHMSSVAVPDNSSTGGIFPFADSRGNIYIAFADAQKKASVLWLNGGTWRYLGKPSFSDIVAWPFSFAEYKHQLYIAFANNLDADVGDSDHHSGKRIEVMRYIAPADKKSPEAFH
jgi:hypothetical protein